MRIEMVIYPQRDFMNIKYISLFSLLLVTGIINTTSYKDVEKMRQEVKTIDGKINRLNDEIKPLKEQKEKKQKKLREAINEFTKSMVEKQEKLRALAQEHDK